MSTILQNIAFVTCIDFPNLHDDDRLVVAELATRNITVTPALWDLDSVDWKSFDLIVIRSPWDYFKRYDEFMTWLGTLEGLPLWNPLSVVRWNSDKTYLRDLAAKGVNIVPTVIVPKGTQRSLEGVISDYGWAKAIVKPTVSGGAYETWMTERQYASQDQSAFEALLRKVDVMVQPFLLEITQHGEWSFLFFDKHYSHTVIKKPRPGDFRVQMQYGGTTETVTPPPALLQQAEHMLALIDDPLLYARVDCVEVDSKLLLMELEVIEPLLFLGYDAAAPARFADAIETRLKK